MKKPPRRRIPICCLPILLVCTAVFATTGTTQHRELDPGSAFGTTKATSFKVVDIVAVIDNSSSMGQIITSFENNLTNLVAQLAGDDVDVRTIIVSKHGDDASESVCIEAPLSNVPPGGCATPPAQPGITDLFKHYSVEIGSLDAWCLLISTFDGSTPDEFSLAPTGWSAWLRDDALRVFLVVSDDGVMCGSFDDDNSIAGGAAAAAAIDSALLALSPQHFGTSSNRNYVVHSLVGLAANAQPTDPWPPSSPITTATCPSAVSPGTGHQGSSVLTAGLRFPVCSTADYDGFMSEIGDDTMGRLPFFADGFESADTTGWTLSNPP